MPDPDFGAIEPLLRLLLALACGVVVGLNRDLQHKPAGVRTFGLVCVSAALIIQVTVQAVGADANAVSRVIQGVLTGIGFIGVGVIFRHDTEHHVVGLTTAASVWFTAALGVACGLGTYRLALAGFVLALLLLVAGKPFEEYFERLARSRKPTGSGPPR